MVEEAGGAVHPGGHADLLRLRMIEGIGALLEPWPLERPVLLVVEDLHWADEPTVQVLDRLARRLQYVGVLLVGTARPHPRPAWLQALERTLAQVDSTTIELGPLGAEHGLELARATLGAEPGPQLATALAQAGGNPLYLTELLAAAARQIDPDGDVADLPTPGVPESVRLAILRNLAAREMGLAHDREPSLLRGGLRPIGGCTMSTKEAFVV